MVIETGLIVYKNFTV